MPPILQPQNNMSSISSLYEQHVADGKLRGDDAQRAIAARLEQLRELIVNVPPPSPKKLFSKLFSAPPHNVAPRSLYIWGDVGRGKSMLMDMFAHAIASDKKRRVHFHAFMTEIHRKVHAFRQLGRHENPVAHVAADMAAQHSLLCLDEFQVTDVADAMILHKLFQTQLDNGVTFVLTSNRPPEELYKGGLQREKFLAFVKLVHERMDILNLDSVNDYRMQQIRAMQTVYFTPRNEAADKSLRDTYRQLTNDAARVPLTLDVQGRKLPVHESSGGVAMFTFHELCEKPLGAADYMEIAKHFHVVLLSGIPRLSAEKRNEARRFVTLIDALYDHRTKLICTAEAAPAELYEKGDGSFEFHRTVSRLAEMQSENYLAAEHLA